MAAAPGLINHQGYLTDDGGVPVDGDREMWFLIYDQEIGGTAVWSEGPMTVPVTDGVFQVLLGQTNPITPFHLAGPRWLEVIVGGEYMEPRERIVSGLYAIEAGNADTLDGAEAAELEESAEIDADVAAHAALASTHHTKTTTFTELTDTATDAQIPDDITITHAAAADFATTAGDADTVDGQDSSAFAAADHTHDDRYYTQAQVDAIVDPLETRIAALEALLTDVTRVGNDITVSGANLHIVDGSGTTDGAVNGLGNLIVGYNELRGSGDDRTGSHNIVVGKEHNYSSYGGLVVGRWNTISENYASISGGYENLASGLYSSVSGGQSNTASSLYSSVSGGQSNTASWLHSSVSGGQSNTAGGNYSSVTGGYGNEAGENHSSVSGGWENIASGYYSSVSGGSGNLASNEFSCVSGGTGNVASGPSASVGGGNGNEASFSSSSVSGGFTNTASGLYSSVSGGQSNTAGGSYSSVTGGALNTASASSSSVSGGSENDASGAMYTVIGDTGSVYVDATKVH